MSRLLAVAAVALALLGSAPVAAETLPAERQVDVFAYFEGIDDTGCVSTALRVSASNGSVLAPPGASTPQPFASAWFQRMDYCAGTDVQGAGYTTAFQLRLHPRLDRASLSASIPVTRYDTGETLIVDVSMEWTGINDVLSFEVPGCRGRNAVAKSRDAWASGSAIVEGSQLAPLPSLSAHMTRSGHPC